MKDFVWCWRTSPRFALIARLRSTARSAPPKPSATPPQKIKCQITTIWELYLLPGSKYSLSQQEVKKKKKCQSTLGSGVFTGEALLNEEDVQDVPVISWLRKKRKKKKIKEQKCSFYIKSSMFCYSLEESSFHTELESAVSSGGEENNNNKWNQSSSQCGFCARKCPRFWDV